MRPDEESRNEVHDYWLPGGIRRPEDRTDDATGGRLVVIENVPAEVCSICGDTLLKPDTVRRIEEILQHAREPDRTAPVYEYAG